MRMLQQQNKKIKELVLLYRASENSFSAQKFHEKCDNIENTLTLIQTQHNKKIGGYTPLKWKNSLGNYENDSSGKSFIFSLTNNHKFTLTTAQYAIYNSSTNGPVFGGGNDICICDKSNTSKASYANPGHSYSHPEYKSGDQATYTKLSGAVSGSTFLVKEWQVFRVIWM